MASLVENFVRRIEKIVSTRSTVPIPGTDHVNSDWLDTDIYPGELSVQFSNGKLYTTDGMNIIELNRENLILYGLELKKDTSGVNKLNVTSGQAAINGVTYFHVSSGTDVYVTPNTSLDPDLIFVYAEPTMSMGASGPLLSISYTRANGTADPSGVFATVADTENYPAPPANSILLGVAMLYPGATGYDLFPLTVSDYGDYYPKFSLTASEFLRTKIKEVTPYSLTTLFFPGQFVVDNTSDTIYVAKKTFVSDYSSISDDITAGNLALLSGGGGGTGSTGGGGSMTAINVGGGVGVYKATVGSQLQYRTLTSTNGITLTYSGSTNEINIGLTYSGIVVGATNTGSGQGVFSGFTGSTGQILRLRSLTAGSSRVTVNTVGDSIVIDVPSVGSTAQGINRGATSSADVYAGMSGADLTFRRLEFVTGMSGTQTADKIVLSSTGRNNSGSNVGGGPGMIYAGMTGDNLMFRSLTAGSNVTITTSGNLIQISSSGSGSSSQGVNIGTTGPTGSMVFAGMSGSNLNFRSLLPGYGIDVSTIGNDVVVTSTLTNGSQGPQGIFGPQGARGFQGPQGLRGASGANGLNGFQGPAGIDGVQGPSGAGFQGPQGPGGPIVTLSAPLRYIDVYDDVAGWSVAAGSIRYISLPTTRINSDPLLYTYGTANNVSAPNGNTVTVNESGDYLLMVNVSGTVGVGAANSAFAECKIWNFTTNSPVPGTKFYLNSLYPSTSGAAVTVSGSTKVALRVLVPTTYGIIITVTGQSNISGYAEGSSFTILKLETGIGPTGNVGPQGNQGPQGTGPQGAEGFQGVEGPAGFQGFQGPEGGPAGPQGLQGPQASNPLATIYKNAPLNGEGSTSTDPLYLSYNTDFALTSIGTVGGATGLMLNLEATTIVSPSIQSVSLIYKSDGSPFTETLSGSVLGPNSTSNNLVVPIGCRVAYGGTATIPAPGSGQGAPTLVSGAYSFSPNPPVSFPASGVTFPGSQLISSTTFTIN